MKPTNVINSFVLPFSKEQLDSMIDIFGSSNIAINYKDSFKNLKCNSSFLNYLANCNIRTVLMENYELDENLEDLLIEYVNMDRQYDINCLDDIWLNILNTKTLGKIEPNFEIFIKKFRKDHSDLILEMIDFFYSLHRFLLNMITDKDEKLNEEVRNAKSAKMTRFNVNIISLMNSGILFYPWICKLYRETPMRMYEEFTKPVLNGNTIISNIINTPNPYKLAMINNQLQDPEKKKKLQEQLDSINSILKEEEK